MKKRTSIVAGLFVVGMAVSGCANDPAVSGAGTPEQRSRSSVDLENGDGMNKTGAGAENGSSASGMDRAGGGLSGSHGANSGAVGSSGAGGVSGAGAGGTGTGAAGGGGAPTPGR